MLKYIFYISRLRKYSGFRGRLEYNFAFETKASLNDKT